MKKLAYLLLLSISLFSCSENSTEEQIEEQLYNVSFNVSTFKQDITNMKSLSPLYEISQELIYLVYNSDNKFLYHKKFENNEENFGEIEDKLPKGEYNIIFLACNNSIDSNDLVNITSNTEYIYYDWEEMNDTFHKKINITIPDDNSDFSVTLNRVVGKLEIILTDNIPEEAYEIEYSLTDSHIGLDLFTGNSSHKYTVSKSGISIVDERGKPNYKLEFFSFVGEETVSCNLTINVFDQEKNLIATKNIRDISLFRNKIVRLSGEMFTANGGTENSFSLKVNDAWSAIIEKTFDEVNDDTIPTVNFTSPSTDASAPTMVTAGYELPFIGSISDNHALKSITFTNLTQRTKSVNDFIQDFNEKFNSKKPSSGSVLDQTDYKVNFSIGTLAGAPAGEYTLTCTVVDKSDNATTKTFYIKVE